MQRVPMHEHRRWTNRHVEREPDRDARRGLWAMVLGIVVATTPLALWQLEQNECLRLSHEASTLHAERDRLQEETRRLRAEREALHSLASIEKWAARRGMVHPPAERVVVVGETATGGAEWLARNAERRGRD